MFKKLRNKFLILNMTIISTVMLIAFGSIYLSMYQRTMTSNKDKLSRVMNLPIGREINIRDPRINGENTTMLPPNYNMSFSLLLDKEGDLLQIVSLIDMEEELYYKSAKEVYKSTKEYGRLKLSSRIWMFHKSNAISARYIGIQVSFLDITESIKTLNNLLITFIIVGLFMLFAIYIISMYFASKAIKPIEESFNMQKQFTMDASHELKTPLTVIDANVDALLLDSKIPKSSVKWLNYIKDETSRMTKLVKDLLYLSKTENIEIEFENIEFNISDIILDVIISMEAIIYEKNIGLNHNIQKNIIYKGDASRLKQVILILIDNAVKYTEEEGTISIYLNQNKDKIELSIENTGTGINKEDIDKVFDRFYRVDKARTNINGSYGLGLAIAKATTERMGGKITVKSNINQLTTFTIILNSK